MAIPTSIKTLLSGDVVEWARIEFKETWDPAASLKSICAFANDLDNWGGGYIVIGVQENNGRPVYPLKGVPMDKLDAYQKNIFGKCKLLRSSCRSLPFGRSYPTRKSSFAGWRNRKWLRLLEKADDWSSCYPRSWYIYRTPLSAVPVFEAPVPALSYRYRSSPARHNTRKSRTNKTRDGRHPPHGC